MWYVIQVRSGSEESIRKQCQKIMDKEILERCFVPKYEEKKRYQGAWHTEEKNLFPGYVFLVSSRLDELYEKLKGIIGMTKLLGTGKEIVSLKEDEIELLEKLEAGEKPVALSEGIIENGKVRVMVGPLMGLEGYIKKIDRHKRKAWLSIKMFGKNMEMEVGLEIIGKTG